MQKSLLVLKKSEYTTKDGKSVYRLHLWVDDGAVEYCVVSVEKQMYDRIEIGKPYKFNYELNIFNSKIYGIKNLRFV